MSGGYLLTNHFLLALCSISFAFNWGFEFFVYFFFILKKSSWRLAIFPQDLFMFRMMRKYWVSRNDCCYDFYVCSCVLENNCRSNWNMQLCFSLLQFLVKPLANFVHFLFFTNFMPLTLKVNSDGYHFNIVQIRHLIKMNRQSNIVQLRHL